MCRIPAFALAACCIVSAVTAVEVDYVSQVKPLLAEKCYSCHGVLKQESGLRLDTRTLMVSGGDSGPAMDPGDPAASPLVERIRSTGSDRMPPHEQGSALTPDQTSILEEWIRQGAAAPDELAQESPETHWAFQPIRRPAVASPTGAANPIDALLDNKLSERSLRAQPQAARPLQIRRLYLDLIGLPPTAGQLEDLRPWSTIVDELLANPQHGERWARHWMDIWRYSDWYGLGDQLRNSQKHLWHWRDWIIDALNGDKGYDRMIMEMLAGDEIAPQDPSVLAATGYLARNYFLFNRTTWLDNTIEHTSKAFLGLTINCAKCHDHKYDPVTHLDYYAMRAVFEPHQVRLDPVPGVTDLEADGLPRVFDDDLTIATYLHLRGDPKQPDTGAVIAPGVPAILAAFAPPIQAIDLPPFAFAPGARPEVQADHLSAAHESVRTAQAELADTQSDTPAENLEESNRKRQLAESKLESARAALRSLEATVEADNLAIARSDADLANRANAIAVRRQLEAQLAEAQFAEAQYRLIADAADEAKAKQAHEQVKSAQDRLVALDQGGSELRYQPLRGSRKALESPADKEQDYPAIYSRTSSGRRLAFARWLTSPQQPLTARVAVNHVWLRHFGTPLVESVFDFGLRAPRPEHIELLDLLAAELIDSGWSLKHLHRLIVTSQAYRRSSSTADADPRCLEVDPSNELLWRMNPRRMESQVVRDSLLAFAGQLDMSVGGPSLDHDHQPPRRSLYLKHSPDQQDKFLEMFDNADVLACYRRSESIVPQQALALANSELAITMAEQIARSIQADVGSTDRRAFIAAVWQTLLARAATTEEMAECDQFLIELDGSMAPSEDRSSRSRARLVHAMLNHNDFITIR